MDTAYVSTDDEEEHSMIEYEEAVELVQEAPPGLAAKIAEQMEQVIPILGDKGDREATIMAFLEETWLLGKSAAKCLRAEAHFKAQREQLKAHHAAVTADEEELASLIAQYEKTKKMPGRAPGAGGGKPQVHQRGPRRTRGAKGH
ncbi:hypothetical protein COEREDRAFT_89487 [Coemansia reversa NRRL 1564]|uniref:Uncharacterized protein n=1 Tax=Coemansia reversa (strain ATCC 12441 / NRRL 1564) TaxID=763665 RepID=A0A2G5B3F3_COERN|nr:hypothetical protein COEREDRAFT_89487 [Coemansia reversa NRRL 1564]|eukprot:PIA13553.1 hypothetical protein COEREDRAFT_89487 [Coemansia reversa NRRL 1564]